MGTASSYFFRDLGITLGRSLRPVLRSRQALVVLAMVLLPLAFVLLLVDVIVSAIQALEELLLLCIKK